MPSRTLLPTISFLFSLTGLVLLLVLSAKEATALHVVSFALFGGALILVYGVHFFRHLFYGRGANFFERINSAFLYILVAATYTPVYLIALPVGWGWSMFGVTWGLTVLGVILKLSAPGLPRWAHTSLYILVDWLVVLAFFPLYASLPFLAVKFLGLGGAFYTMATLFEREGRVFAPQFAMALGSLAHFWLMYKYVLSIV